MERWQRVGFHGGCNRWLADRPCPAGQVGSKHKPPGGRFWRLRCGRPGSVKDRRTAVAQNPDLQAAFILAARDNPLRLQGHPGVSLSGAWMAAPRNGDVVYDDEHVGAVFLDLGLRPPRWGTTRTATGLPGDRGGATLNKSRHRLSWPSLEELSRFPFRLDLPSSNHR
jgi:hypothetical protein